ncbi:MAG: DNA polymerase/3'-5' exonuclease PolX [bacterium]
MNNQELAQIFNNIADFLEMEGMERFKPFAYRKAALVLGSLEKDVAEIYRIEGKKGLEELSGIGESLAEKIEEYLQHGKIKYYEELKKKTPINVEELNLVSGIGPKMIKTFYKELGVRNLKDLEKAVKAHKVASLFGFGGKTEQNILEGLTFLKKSKGRHLLGDIMPIVVELENYLQKKTGKISVAGSVRRKKATIGDIDLLAVAEDPGAVMDSFISLPGVVKVWGKGKTKSSIRLRPGFDVDLRVVPEESYGSALQYFTGSKEHNIAVRKIAQSKKLKLNEYGVFSGRKRIAGKTEAEVYGALGLEYIPPELRENQGEVEAALRGNLPKLVEVQDIKGDLHCHISGSALEEMIEEAKARGYQYLGISDHTKFLKIEHGLDERQLAQQRKKIDKLNAGMVGFKVLQGAETNILKNGTIDIKDEALAKLDYTIAGVHSNFKMTKEEMTERIIRAMKNPNIKIIAHLTGRMLKLRDGYQIDFDKILRAAKETNTILEINSQPLRLDIEDVNIKRAKEAGVKMVISTDSHHKDHLRFMEFGVYQARRGWAEKKDIINTSSLGFLRKHLK